jgi:ADP-ribose pyrophosphatase
MDDYFQLMRVRPDLFANPEYNSLIRVETDPQRINSIESSKVKELISKGGCSENAKVGIVYHDQFLMVLRDAVVFPNGKTGTYIRAVSETKENHGVVILPKYGNKWVLIEHFRHATRNIEIEIPRGFSEPDLSGEQNALRELKEEINCTIKSLYPLGSMVENSGLSESETYLYLADVDSIGEPDIEEGIERIVLYSTDELMQSIKENRIKDSFTVSAVLKAYLLGYMS